MKYGIFAILVALLTLALKLYAAWITGSVGLFSDAMESIVNVVTSIFLVALLKVAQSPPDDDHPHGHDKAEYFANGIQGALILLAAIGIAVAALQRFHTPVALESGALGLCLSTLGGVINLWAAYLLKKAGKQLRSTALVGEAAHLMSDVWTSVAVLVGVALVYVTGHQWLDPVVALVLSVLVFKAGWDLIKQFVNGMMDSSIDLENQNKIESVLEHYQKENGIEYHALRTRVSGARIFISVHVLVPGEWTVDRGHDLIDRLECEIQEKIEGSSVLTHLEPKNSKKSFQDIDL